MILVVDDYPDIVAVLCHFLRRAGYEAAGAGDGLEALKMMASRTPDLVILDVQMPNLDGVGVLRAMRDDDRLRAVPVVMYSAGHENQRDEAMELGARAFMLKGAMSIENLLAEVAKHTANAA